MKLVLYASAMHLHSILILIDEHSSSIYLVVITTKYYVVVYYYVGICMSYKTYIYIKFVIYKTI